MGVELDHYVMFAVKFPSLGYFVEQVCGGEENYDEICEKFEEKPHDLELVDDGMGDEYVFIGKILAHGDEFEGLSVTNCVPKEILLTDKIALVKKVGRALGVDLESDNYEYEVGIWAFTHFH